MSVTITHHRGIRVARLHPETSQDSLAQVVEMLPALLESRDRLVLDLSAVTLTPPRRIADFLRTVCDHRAGSATEIILVAERLSARRLLRTMSPDGDLRIVATIADADPACVDGWAGGKTARSADQDASAGGAR
jgi:hypothetical protein